MRDYNSYRGKGDPLISFWSYLLQEYPSSGGISATLELIAGTLIVLLTWFFLLLSLKGEEKATYRRMDGKRKKMLKNQKRDLRERSLMCSDKCFYCICYYTIYYQSLCGRRQVAEPPKIMCVMSFYLDQFLLSFINQPVSNGLRFICAKVLFAVLYLLHFMFRDRASKEVVC